jgi:hypothetical protein
MNCNFDNDSMACPVCGKRGPSRKAKSNCLPTITAEELQALSGRFSEMAGRRGDALAAQTHGPGTELSKLLKRFGIEPTPTCQCRAKAAEMDAWGCDECSKPERIEEVVAVMREEAKARGLPFVDMAGRVLVRRAISNARKEAARATPAANAQGSEA